MEPLRFDPFHESTRDDPYPIYARLRNEAPVFRADALGAFVVSRHHDVLAALKDPATFSSRPFAEMMQGVGTLIEESGAAPDDEPWTEFPHTLIGSDPPVHTRLRKIANRGFTQARVAALEPRIRAIAEELANAFVERGHCELVSDFAAPLPVTVIAELLGVEPERHRDFKRWSDAAIAAISGAPGERDPAALGPQIVALGSYLEEMIVARRAAPRDDLISALVRAEGNEEVLGEREVKLFSILLLVAGNETTTHLIGNLFLALLDHPDEWRRTRERPGRVAALVEEALRFDAPVQLTLRRAARATELAGMGIPEGALVALLLGSANRDERCWPRAEHFDPDRAPLGHLAFGFGTHFCLGAALARLEARVALEVLLARIAKLEGGGAPVPRIGSLILRGPVQLPLRFTPAVRSVRPSRTEHVR
jgi:cytochrome P450